MSLDRYRSSQNERLRVGNLMGLIPHKGQYALDVGARDGFLSLKLVEFFQKVTAIDLEKPTIKHDQVDSRAGNITNLEFPNSSFDLVLCAEVLEHIPTEYLQRACDELARVTKDFLLIGVPFNQDLRFGRTTCYSCNGKNPPWGHVNKFDLSIIEKLFTGLSIQKVEYVGASKSRTNFFSTYLMNLAGNPYGTYSQDEMCIHCGHALISPPERMFTQKILTKIAVKANEVQQFFVNDQPNWIHVLFKK